MSSDFINEAFALRANLEPWQIGLGHAFEINPATPDQVVYQVADAQLIRQLFPEYPLKYMPPTKYMPGDIFQGHIIDGMFNFTGIFTGQDDHAAGHAHRGPAHAAAAGPLRVDQERQVRLRGLPPPGRRGRVPRRAA